MIKTGKGPINLMVVMAIWALSLAVDLPGLAITPVLAELKTIFPDATELEVQLLTVLPNVFIIPFVLWSGKLSLSKHKVAIVVLSLIIYLIAAILYLFAKSMIELIIFSCLLGVGCGLLIPFSTGLIADVFTGKYRMTQMGIISAIGNLTVVIATFIVGYLVMKNWHFPFLVYLVPIIPLCLAPWLKKIPKADLENEQPTQHTQDTPQAPALWPAKPGEKIVGGFYLGRTLWLYAAYFFFVYATTVPSLYVSFLLGAADSAAASWVTSAFYIAMVVVGFILNPILRAFKRGSFVVAFICLLIGFGLFCITKAPAWLITGYCIMGIGNGMAQPIFYDKATECITSDSKSTLSLAFLLAANYAAISLAPEIISLFQWIFHTHSVVFPFIFNFFLTAGVFVIQLCRINGFVFGIKKEYYD